MSLEGIVRERSVEIIVSDGAHRRVIVVSVDDDEPGGAGVSLREMFDHAVVMAVQFVDGLRGAG
jgi:hypothetical protein